MLQRPSLLTWSFFLIALSVQPGAWTQAFLSDRLIVTYTFLANASVIAGAAASVIFAMLFPRTQPSPAIRRTAEALAFFGIALLIFDTANGYSQIFGWVTHGSAAWAALVKALTYRAMVGLSVTAIVMFGINYLRSLPRERLRMQWVALGFAVGNCGSALPLVLGGFFGVEMPLAAVNAMLALTIFIPVSVAYAIAKHRVLDIRFFLSRALIYSCVSVIIVGTFVLAEWAAGTWLAGLTHATGPAVVIATALGLGLSLRPIYALADNLVNTVLFKKQFQARALLARMGAGLPYAESTDGIMDVLTRGVCENLQLVSAALFRRDESGLFAAKLPTDGAPATIFKKPISASSPPRSKGPRRARQLSIRGSRKLAARRGRTVRRAVVAYPAEPCGIRSLLSSRGRHRSRPRRTRTPRFTRDVCLAGLRCTSPRRTGRGRLPRTRRRAGRSPQYAAPLECDP